MISTHKKTLGKTEKQLLIKKVIKTEQKQGKKTDLPAESNRNNASPVLSNLKKHRHGEIKMRARWIAPPTIITGQFIIWWAKVSGCDEYGWASWVAPSRVVSTFELIT